LLVILAWRWSVAKVAAAGLAISVAAALSIQYINGLHRVLIPDALPFYLCGFCLGMLSAEVVIGRPSRRALLAVSCIGFLAAALAIPLEHFSPSSVVLSSVWAVGFAALVIVGAGGTMQRVLSWRPLRSLGLASFSAYLIHGTVFLLISIPLSRLAWGVPARTAVYFLIGIPVAVGTAWVFFRSVESPIHRKARDVARRYEAERRAPAAAKPNGRVATGPLRRSLSSRKGDPQTGVR
jgi:peptidoglycan/LPS O-acetylase OafA/YrhL